MAINGYKYEDPQNERWAVKGVEAAIKELQKEIEKLKSDIKRLEGRTR